MELSSREVKILLLAGSEADTELCRQELGKAGVRFVCSRVETRDDFRDRLRDFKPDIVLADCGLPSFEGPSALKLVRETLPDLPVILLSAAASDTLAAESLKSDATDFVVKSALGSLGHAVKRAMRELSERADLAKAEEARLESEDRFRRITLAVADYIYTVTVENGRPVRTRHGEACTAVTGYTPEEFADDRGLWLRMVVEEDRPAVIEQAHKVLAGRAAPLEHRIIRKDGTLRWVRNTPVPHYDAGGSLVSYDGVIQHVPERRRAEESLRASEERFRGVVDHIAIGVAVIGPGMEILSLNQQMRAWFPNIKPGEKSICYRGFNTPPRETPCSYCPTIVTLRDGKIHESVTETPTPSGIVNYRVVASPIKDTQGKVVAAIEMVEDISERKRAEAAVKESEAKYRALFEDARDGIALADAETGTLADCNRALCRMVERDKTELLGRNQSILHPPQDLVANLSPTFLQHKTGDPGQPLEDLLLSKSGELIPVEIRAGRVRVNDRDYLIGIFRDITERKRAEESLRESQARIQAITDSAQDAILMMDPEGRISYWNPAAEQVLGYTSEEAMGRNLHELLAPERYREAQRAAFPEFQRTGRGAAVGKTLELEALRKSGEEVSIALSLSTVELRDQWHAVGILRDITERKRIEAALSQTSRQLKAVLDAATRSSIIATDVHGLITVFNTGAERMLGYSAEEMVGKRTPESIHLESEVSAASAKLSERFGRAIRGFDVFVEAAKHGDYDEREWTYVRKDGGRVPVSLAVTAQRGSAGEITGFLGVALDISERKKAEEALQRTNAQLVQAGKLAALGEIAAGMAHELNQPLTVIQACVHMLRETLSGYTPQEREILSLVIKVTRRMARIIDNMRAFARKEKPRLGSVSPSQPLEDALALFSEQLRLRGIKVERATQEGLPEILSDAGRLQEVFMNLLANARDALEAKPGDQPKRLRISVSRRGNAVEYSIEDNGPGVGEEDRQRLFEPFFTTKPSGKGTGLGLSLSHGIINVLGGQISFAPVETGGARFTVRIPLPPETPL